MTSSLISSIPGFIFAGSASSVAIASDYEVFPRKQMPVNAVGFPDINPRWVRSQMDVFFGRKNFEMLRINASRRSANMVQMPSFRNWSAKHQAGGEERLSVYVDSAIARNKHRSGPEPATAVWLYLVFFLKHLLCISTFL